jgi:acyl transferase domain-containing protein
VTGYPSRISEIAASSLLSTKPVKSGSTTFGLWHASHVYGEGSVAEILEPRFDALSKIRLPHMQQLSPTTGQPLECESAHALVATAVQNILREPIRWDLLQDTLSTYTDRTVLAFGDRSAITELDAPNPDTIEKQVDISTGATQYAGFDDPNGDKIAIVGMSARLPGATDVDMLWDLLVNGRDLHKRVPKDRFPVDTHFDVTGKKQNTSHSPYGCFIENPGMFDARFFHMSPREAAQTDPMHRLALVTAYEALEMSGFVLNSTPSSQSARVGTFYGQTSDDWREVNAAQDISTYFIPGGVRAFAPGRISYHFGFSGPSYSVDTACSSSMAAVQLGCTALRSRECDTVVAGGLNVLTAPDIFAGLSRGQFLSKTGPCQTWDINADGYCRADGVASVILKRYEDALAEKDNILGVILATATNHSADAISITHPHAGNQAQLFESVLHNAGVNPLDISYIEMHGTGTQAGDLAETQSVTSVFAPVGARSPEQTLHIGAIKSNIGHSEAAAGISALVKILLMIQKNIIPPHVGIKTQLNPALPDFNNRNVRIAREAHPWPQNLDKARLMFLNNFSAAGGNTAMLLQEHLPQQVESKADPRSALPILISARTLTSLRKNIQRLTSFLESTPDVSLGSLSYTLSARRMQHSYRVGTVATSISNLKESLAQLEVVGLAPIPSRAPKVAFTYTGQGAFYINCARDLLKQSIVFRDVVNHYNHLAISMGGSSFLPMIDGSAAADQEFPPSAVHVATTCMQMALTRLWESWGLQPALVIGHSLGEYAALNAAGVLSDTDTIFLVMQRAKLLEEKCVAGTHAMLAVNASIAEIEAATHAHGFTYDIACINSAKDVVLASEISTIQKLSDILKKGSYRCATLNLPYAFHSKQLDPVLDEFEHIARGAVFNKPKIPVLSPLYAQVVEENIFSPEYLRNHARKTVDFTGALQQATEDGLIDAKTVFVEIGLHPLCSKMVKSHFDTTVTALPSLQRDRTAWEVLSKTVVSLHCAAVSFDWRQFHRDFETSHQLLQLPSYGFEEKNYWIDYVNDWCLHKLEPRDVVRELPAPPVAAPPKRLSASVHRVMTEDVEDDVITVVTETDLSAPELKNVLMGHQVNDTPLCSSVSF